MPTPGKITGIFIAERAGIPLVPITTAHILPDRGIEGDRYFTGVGSFSRWPGSGRAVSMIEEEVIEAILKETGLDLSNGRSRRNIVTRACGFRISMAGFSRWAAWSFAVPANAPRADISNA